MQHGGQRWRIEARVGDLWPEDRWVKAQVGGSIAGRSGGQVTPCAIRIVHVEETRNTGFAVWPQNCGAGFAVWPQNRGGGFEAFFFDSFHGKGC